MKHHQSSVIISIIFTSSIFLSAFLLFTVQPMIGKAILPLLGGAPDVWNTCMLFYQVLLLLGYYYAHIISTYLTIKKQTIVHALVVLLGICLLPIGVAKNLMPPQNISPYVWAISILVTSVGLPFFVLSTTSPLLQRWFSLTNHPRRNNPYFLYGASNAGSLLAILAYLLLIEPNFTVARQNAIWGFSFVILAVLIISIVAGLLFTKIHNDVATPCLQPDTYQKTEIPFKQQLYWLLCALCPSSLMLSLTNRITADISPLPLLWMLPLSLYLLTFIICFSRFGEMFHNIVTKLFPITAITFVMYYVLDTRAILLEVSLFFITALFCHGQLAKTKPNASMLTKYYLIMSVGGACGGLLSSIIAPLVFNSLAEYPLIYLVSLFLRNNELSGKELSKKSLTIVYTSLGMLGAFAILYHHLFSMSFFECFLVLSLFIIFSTKEYKNIFAALVTMLFCLSTYIASNLNLRIDNKKTPESHLFKDMATNVTNISFLNHDNTQANKKVLEIRNFFGRFAVKDRLVQERKLRLVVHGTTVHGAQDQTDATSRKYSSLTYYRQGNCGISDVFELFFSEHKNARIGVLGLGTGSMACYKTHNQKWTFHEIDPDIVKLSTGMEDGTKLFTYLSDCTPDASIFTGDARLLLQNQKLDNPYDLLIADTFSSDMIPAHLLTKEAFELYLSKIDPENGILLLHISNRYLDLEPVIQAISEELNLNSVIKLFSPSESQVLVFPSKWVVVTNNSNIVSKLKDNEWVELKGNKNVKAWHDDFYNLINIIVFDRLLSHL